ncbi:MAG TPA: TetR family transcriptional regulator [Acidimicrobiales bacterium]
MPPSPDDDAKGGKGFPLATLVERTGVPASTIHHYRRSGLLPEPGHDAGNRLIYDERHVKAVCGIRLLREQRAVPLNEIPQLLPALLAEQGEALAAGRPGDPDSASSGGAASTVSRRLIDAAIELFQTRGYAEVTVSEIAERAGVAKGSVYRHFSSKEAVFAAAIEAMVGEIASRFAAAVTALGGAEGAGRDRDKVAAVFAEIMDPSMPILLELGLKAAQGQPASLNLAVWMLRTLIDATGRPLAGATGSTVDAGIWVIEAAFAAVLRSALEPE